MNSGNRLVVVCSVTPLAVTVRNSGSYWKCSPIDPHALSAAGLSGDSASISPNAPPDPMSRVLSCPGGYPCPSVLTFPCAPADPVATANAMNTNPDHSALALPGD